MNEAAIPQKNISDIGAAYAKAAGGYVERHPGYTTTVAPGFFYVRNIIDAPEKQEMKQVIQEILTGKAEGKTTSTTFTKELVPEGTVELFRENGFDTYFIQDGMILDPGAAAVCEIDPHVRRIGPEELSRWMDAMLEGFAEESGKQREEDVFAKMMTDPDFYFLVYEEADVIKGTVLFHLLKEYSGIHEVAVPRQFRGQGISKKILYYALRVIAENGNRGAALQASPMGRPVYETLGFRKVSELHTVFAK